MPRLTAANRSMSAGEGQRDCRPVSAGAACAMRCPQLRPPHPQVSAEVRVPPTKADLGDAQSTVRRTTKTALCHRAAVAAC